MFKKFYVWLVGSAGNPSATPPVAPVVGNFPAQIILGISLVCGLGYGGYRAYRWVWPPSAAQVDLNSSSDGGTAAGTVPAANAPATTSSPTTKTATDSNLESMSYPDNKTTAQILLIEQEDMPGVISAIVEAGFTSHDKEVVRAAGRKIWDLYGEKAIPIVLRYTHDGRAVVADIARRWYEHFNPAKSMDRLEQVENRVGILETKTLVPPPAPTPKPASPKPALPVQRTTSVSASGGQYGLVGFRRAIARPYGASPYVFYPVGFFPPTDPYISLCGRWLPTPDGKRLVNLEGTTFWETSETLGRGLATF